MTAYAHLLYLIPSSLNGLIQMTLATLIRKYLLLLSRFGPITKNFQKMSE